MIWMQKIALFSFLLLLLGQTTVWSQGVYNYRTILKNTSVSDRINQCYWPDFVDSSKNGQAELVKFSQGKYDLNYTPASGFEGSDTVVIKYESEISGGKIVYKSFVYFVTKSILEPVADYISVYAGQSNIEFKPLTNDISTVGVDKLKLSTLQAYNNISGVPTMLNDSTIKFSVTADSSFNASISYRVCDSYGLCKDGIVNISVVDTTTLKATDTLSFYTPEDIAVQISLPYSGFGISQNAKHGKVDIVEASFKYAPYKNFNGKDTFKLVNGNLSRLIIANMIPQDEPNSIIVPDIVHTPVNTEVSFDVSLNDVSSLVKLYAIGIDKLPNKGTLTLINNKGLFKYIPESGYDGVQTFSYKVCPQGICESTTVKIFVGDYAPQTGSTYDITTYKNTPILLSYQVPVDAYNFSASKDSIKFYPGWDTVDVTYNGSCNSKLIGYNQLIYYPLINSFYNDTLTINYCIAGTNNCVQAQLHITVLNESKNCPKQCVGDCVWPGDVDQNGCVDMKDLLNLASVLGKTGAQRTYVDNTFRSHKCIDWGEVFTNSGIDIKNGDCNGDSTINMLDTLAIFNSYKSLHSLVPNEVFSKGNFPINFEILTPEADSGDIGMIEVQLGDDQYPAINVTGYSYEVDYPVNMINESSLYVSYYEQGWFGRSATLLNMFKKPWDGRLESGFVRANNLKVSGKGGTEVLVFIVEDDLVPWSDDERYASFQFRNAFYTDSNGEKFAVDDKEVKFRLKREKREGPVELNDKKLIVFPNPSSEYFNVFMNGRNTISSFKVFSMEGKEVLSNNTPDPKSNTIFTKGLSNGMYILKVETPVGAIIKKLQIVN